MLSIVRFFVLATLLAGPIAGCAQQKLKRLEQRVAALERADEAIALALSSRATIIETAELMDLLRAAAPRDYSEDHLGDVAQYERERETRDYSEDRLEDVAQYERARARRNYSEDRLEDVAQYERARETRDYSGDRLRDVVLLSDFIPRVTGWTWLLRGETEEAGFGLYSYLLITSRPINDEQSRRYAMAIEAVTTLSHIRSLEEAGAQRRLLNATHIPVMNTPHPPFADLVLVDEGYDYDRAAVLMSRVGRPVNSSGPFIVSTLAPLSQHASPQDYLFQDLSESPLSLVPAWIAAFKAQAAKEEFWKPDSIIEFALKLRGTVIDAALVMKVLPEAAAKVGNLIIVVKNLVRWPSGDRE